MDLREHNHSLREVALRMPNYVTAMESALVGIAPVSIEESETKQSVSGIPFRWRLMCSGAKKRLHSFVVRSIL